MGFSNGNGTITYQFFFVFRRERIRSVRNQLVKMENAKRHVHVIMMTDLSDPEHARRGYKIILNAETDCLF